MDSVLFLDIDGVLNSQEFFERARADALSRRPIWHMLDPEKVTMLNEILAATGAKVVVSSSWRIPFTMDDIYAALTHRGFRGTIIGKTPSGGRTRGDEIQAWLDFQATKPVRFAILDDSADMAHLAPFLVRTTWELGMEQCHVGRAIEMLCEPAGWWGDT